MDFLYKGTGYIIRSVYVLPREFQKFTEIVVFIGTLIISFQKGKQIL